MLKCLNIIPRSFPNFNVIRVMKEQTLIGRGNRLSNFACSHACGINSKKKYLYHKLCHAVYFKYQWVLLQNDNGVLCHQWNDCDINAYLKVSLGL